MIWHNREKRSISAPLRAVWASACVLLLAAPAAAQSGSFGFTLDINSREKILTTPGSEAAYNYATWIPRSQMKLALKSPTLMLTNDANSDAAITELRLTIGDDRFHFTNSLSMFKGQFAIPGLTNPNASLSSSIDDDGDLLIVNFGSGLLPGESICVRIALGVDADHPEVLTRELDYKTVLFDKNGIQAYDGFVVDFSTDDNAIATVKFGPPTSPLKTLEAVLPDAVVSESESAYYFRAIRSHSNMMGATTVTFGPPSEATIPEPSGMLLGLLACWGGALLRGRRRRQRIAG